MSDPQALRIDRLQRVVDRLATHRVIATASGERLERVEPAEPRFDAPPDDAADWHAFGPNETWGQEGGWVWFRGPLTVPADWPPDAIELHVQVDAAFHGRAPGYVDFPAGPEGQVFVDRQRLGAIDRKHHTIRHRFQPGQTLDVRAVFFAGRVPGQHRISHWRLRQVDHDITRLYHDLRVALDHALLLPASSATRELLLRAVEGAGRQLPPGEGRPDPAMLAAAQARFDQQHANIPTANDAPAVTAVGHGHIDLAWLWNIEQARHKCVRTFATQCRLLDQYPHWLFQQSSPQAYRWVQEHAPDLFDRICTHVDHGRWEADGATWVEMDTNVPDGESLVRQLLYGKRYFREQMNVDSRLLWLPDVFGYSAALPQLLDLADVDSFVTSKISWSDTNRFPFDTFRWRGIDGTETLTHFITTPDAHANFLTYNAMMTPREVRDMWADYRHKESLGEPLLTFGHGDGGGGPTESMLETATRMVDHPIEGLPRLKLRPVRQLMDQLRQQQADLPVWDGELYLEYHRGTYTTHAWLKRTNRLNERRLHSLEWLASLAAAQGYRLDKPRLDRLWEDLLLLQFHDILPGSSVREVYRDDAGPMHERIASEAEQMTREAVDALTRSVDTTGHRQPLVLLNTLAWDRTDPIRLPDGSWRDDITIPAGGWQVIDATTSPKPADPELAVRDDGRVLTNRYWQLTLDEKGRIASLHDRQHDRTVLPPNELANVWQLFEDRPRKHEAWNIDADYEAYPLPAPVLAEQRIVEQGSARVAVELVWTVAGAGEDPVTSITQRIALYGRHPRIDFETHVDWHLRRTLLKVAFPVDVRACDAAFEIQFGHIRRATHRNTSWDQARFEVCMHRWVDLSEHGYGVSLLNDSKYGCDVRDRTIRLTCLRGPNDPDPEADRGEHRFIYSLLPHTGSFQQAGTVQAAAELNTPPIVSEVKATAGSQPARQQAVLCDNDAVVLDTLKPAEDGQGIIARFYEAHGSHARAAVRFAKPFTRVEPVDLLEQPRPMDTPCVGHDGDEIVVRLRPFQVLSLRLQ